MTNMLTTKGVATLAGAFPKKIKLFSAQYEEMNLTISATEYGLFELKTCDAENGVIKTYVTFDEAYSQINECLDEADDSECQVTWHRDYFKVKYYEYMWDIHASYDYEYAEI